MPRWKRFLKRIWTKKKRKPPFSPLSHQASLLETRLSGEQRHELEEVLHELEDLRRILFQAGV
ncbi:unnamed protein product [Pararhodospirillum photometricum DSM 122]|uniref:Uncharacterized protein n=1 Tax=Pararhodospirillum photometricum DSM 122 TaxID=1150469 RepID=H6SLX1_PARPM|nr:unnamed protein product [Pararhodospirillum photometricum DSM 122]